MEKNYRLFLRNLPIDIDSENLQNFFAEHGKVTKIDIKEKIQSDGGKIAFVNVTTTDSRLNTCFRLAREKSFGGRAVQVQLAKESYLDRLKREREEAAESARAPHLASPPDDVSLRRIDKINIKVPAGAQSRSTKKKYDFEDAPENERDAAVSSEPPDFSWDPALQEPTIPAVESRPAPSKASHPTPEKPKQKVLVRSEIKKLAAMEEMNKTFHFRRNLITRALRTVDSSGSTGSNKIVFSQDDDPIVSDEKKSSAVSLFDNEDNSDDEEDRHVDKFEHDEARCAKLKLSLSNRNGDKRFVIDERFLDDAKEGANDDGKAAAAAATVTESETEWQLNILEKVLGTPIERRKDASGEGTKNKRKVYPMIRYDPDDEAYQKYELAMKKPEIEPKKAKKSRRAVQREEAPPPPPPPPPLVSGEIHWKVSENLKDSFNTQGEFSLLKSFGTAAVPNDKNSTGDYVGASVAAASSGEKFMEYGIKDAFKYESSSDEEGPSINDLASGSTKSGTIKDARDDNDEEEEPFFFVKNDPRFREAMEFLTKRPPIEDFASVRRQLKQIVRSKIRNNARRNNRWRNSKVAKRPNIR